MKKADYIAKQVLAKGKRVTVRFHIHPPHEHSKKSGTCAECKKSKDGVAVMNIAIGKVLNEHGTELSARDRVATTASSKVLGTLRNGKRVCNDCRDQIIEVAKRPDSVGQVFAN
ncbi:MAG: hypothetical protein AAB920_02050 [Patescibacteria group bacterium]|mgnify:CR=1 FL=1